MNIDSNSQGDLLKKKRTSEQSNFDTYELNIRPQASILNVFSRLSYKSWYAIAEFVDNSTQSYFSNLETLKKDNDFTNLNVDITYNADDNMLIIEDNAFGMEIDRFKDAILLDSRSEKQQGRNEFGMGLKTAASWFGNVWSVTSTQYMSQNQYSATINIPELRNNGVNSVEIYRTTVNEKKHGTVIIIRDITKKITGSRTISKIKDLLSSMYRRDINNRNIEIRFNGEPISFQDYPVLSNFRERQWKKPLDFYVDFENKKYHVSGFVAIMDPGSFLKAGFALFRHGRVVIGGTDLNYKPSQIFGQPQSQRSLKLFGELDMNDFPVNQAKDGFVWDDGLEDAFINNLKDNIQEYIEIADISIKERAKESEFSKEASQEVQKEVEKALSKCNADVDINIHNNPIINLKSKQDLIEYKNTILAENEKYDKTKVVGSNRFYDISINAVNKKRINVNWAIGKKEYWIDYTEENGVINVLININHPFFKPYSNEEKFKIVLEKFVLSFVIAEQQAQVTSDKKGYIIASTIRNNMNKYLSKMEEE